MASICGDFTSPVSLIALPVTDKRLVRASVHYDNTHDGINRLMHALRGRPNVAD